MIERKRRIIAEEFRNGEGFNVLAGITIRDEIASYSLTKEGHSGATFSDAEIELFIAQIKVAKEKAAERADRVIRLLETLKTA